VRAHGRAEVLTLVQAKGGEVLGLSNALVRLKKDAEERRAARPLIPKTYLHKPYTRTVSVARVRARRTTGDRCAGEAAQLCCCASREEPACMRMLHLFGAGRQRPQHAPLVPAWRPALHVCARCARPGSLRQPRRRSAATRSCRLRPRGGGGSGRWAGARGGGGGAELQAAAAAALEHGQVRCRARAGPGPTARHVPGAQGTQRPCIDMAGAYFA